MMRVAGTVLIVSVIVFAAGAMQPVVLKFFSADSGLFSNYYLIQEQANQWRFANIMMGLSSLVAAIGVIIFTISVRQNTENNIVTLIAIVCTILVSGAAALWLFISLGRIILPPLDVAAGREINDWDWAFSRFTELMTAGIILLGFVIMLASSRWGGALVMAVEIVNVVAQQVITQDIIPGTHFLPILIASIALFLVEREKKHLRPAHST